MKAKVLLAMASGIFAASMSSAYAQSDDEKKKPIKPAEHQQILSQSDDEPKKPKKPEEPKLQPIQS